MLESGEAPLSHGGGGKGTGVMLLLLVVLAASQAAQPMRGGGAQEVIMLAEAEHRVDFPGDDITGARLGDPQELWADVERLMELDEGKKPCKNKTNGTASQAQGEKNAAIEKAMQSVGVTVNHTNTTSNATAKTQSEVDTWAARKAGVANTSNSSNSSASNSSTFDKDKEEDEDDKKDEEKDDEPTKSAISKAISKAEKAAKPKKSNSSNSTEKPIPVVAPAVEQAAKVEGKKKREEQKQALAKMGLKKEDVVKKEEPEDCSNATNSTDNSTSTSNASSTLPAPAQKAGKSIDVKTVLNSTNNKDESGKAGKAEDDTSDMPSSLISTYQQMTGKSKPKSEDQDVTGLQAARR